MAMAKVIQLFPKDRPAPKGTAWLVYHRNWKGGGCRTAWAFVYNFDTGLTAHEAWTAARLTGNPPFYETVTVQLSSFPSPVRKRPSVNTRNARKK